jgi:D-ribitol-5-phosphate cytidylyltransferase
MRVGMIVLAGGIGRRIGQPYPKQFLLVGGKPMLIHVLEKARALPSLERIVVTCPESHIDETRELMANHGFGDRFECIEGGQTRQESVYRGILALDGVESIVVHEAVRPLVSLAEFRALIDAPDENVMYGIPISFTVLKGHEYIEDLLERSELVNVQLPQKFNAARLREVHEQARADGTTFTEDASLFHRYGGGRVRILPGSDRNLKITVPTDLVIAEAIYADSMGRISDVVGHD